MSGRCSATSEPWIPSGVTDATTTGFFLVDFLDFGVGVFTSSTSSMKIAGLGALATDVLTLEATGTVAEATDVLTLEATAPPNALTTESAGGTGAVTFFVRGARFTFPSIMRNKPPPRLGPIIPPR